MAVTVTHQFVNLDPDETDATITRPSDWNAAHTATGLTTTGASGIGIILVTSAAFDSTVANSIIGASFNGGSLFVGTNTVVQSVLCNV